MKNKINKSFIRLLLVAAFIVAAGMMWQGCGSSSSSDQVTIYGGTQ